MNGQKKGAGGLVARLEGDAWLTRNDFVLTANHSLL
jgi:hypothetical protein